jgi:RimJ/RimL family protein N-acetyltransferase
MPRLTTPILPAGSLNSTEQPVLHADGLLLRPWTEADADALLTAFADPAIQRWGVSSLNSMDEAHQRIASYNEAWHAETAAHWAITGPEVLGRVALRVIDLREGCAEIAYWVTPAARGRGTAVRAAVTISKWALQDLGLHRIDLQHSVANSPSCKVAAKAGFTYEGTKRSALLHADGWHDMHVHARIQDDT